MSVWDDFIRRLEQDLAECRSDLELLERASPNHSTTAYPPSCSCLSARADHDSCAIAALRLQRRRSGSPSRNFRPCARWVPGCRSVTNASMATTFNAFTRATITHCNSVCRINCERAVGQFDCGGGFPRV